MYGARTEQRIWGWAEFFVKSSPEKIVATEKFDESWYPGDALDTTEFAEDGETTRVTINVLYVSKEARDTARRSGMEQGMAAGYDRLEELLAAMPVGGAK